MRNDLTKKPSVKASALALFYRGCNQSNRSSFNIKTNFAKKKLKKQELSKVY